MTREVLDCSDLDRYLGKPMEPARLKERLGNSDIRRWVQAMHYPNRLHYDEGFAADSRCSRVTHDTRRANLRTDGAALTRNLRTDGW